MLPSKKVVLVAIACCVTVASGGEPRFLMGGSGVNMFAGGSFTSGGHGGNSLSGGGGAGRPAGNGGWSNSGGAPGGNFGGGSSAGQFGGYQEETYPPRPYNFSYAVKDRRSGVDFGHSERTDGENVRGQYHVLLPDGRTQVVTYSANWRTGYKADVQYMGRARYPPPSSNSGFGWPSSGNEKPFTGNPQPFVSNNNGGQSNRGPSSGNVQPPSGNGWPSGKGGSNSKGPSSGFDPLNPQRFLANNLL